MATAQCELCDESGDTVERRVYRAIRLAQGPTPGDKELPESLGFIKRLRKDWLAAGSPSRCIEVAGGHGLVSLLLLSLGLSRDATIVDPFRPRSFDTLLSAFREAGLLPESYSLQYDERPLDEALPYLLRGGDGGGGGTVVVACHACAHLTRDLVEIAVAERAAGIAVMPCCHSRRTVAGADRTKHAADALGLPLGVVADIALLGRLEAAGYDARLRVVEACAPSSNRVVVAFRRGEGSGGARLWEGSAARARASEGLSRAYERVHAARPAGTGRKARNRERREYRAARERDIRYAAEREE